MSTEIVFSYYFPVGKARSLDVSSIKCIRYAPHGEHWWRIKSWGMALSNTWWACDFTRHFRGQAYNVSVNNGESHEKGFSVCDVHAFLDAIRPLLPTGAQVVTGLE